MFLAHFWPIYPNFGAQIFFSGKSDSAKHNFIWFLAPCQNLEKINDAIPRKRLNRRKDGQKDRSYFMEHLRLPPGVQQKNTGSTLLQIKKFRQIQSNISLWIAPFFLIYLFTLWWSNNSILIYGRSNNHITWFDDNNLSQNFNKKNFERHACLLHKVIGNYRNIHFCSYY